MAVCVCLRAIQPKLQMAVWVSCYTGLPLCCHGTPQCDPHPPFKPAFHFHWACLRESIIMCGASCRSLDREVQMVVVGMHLLQLDFKYLTFLSTHFRYRYRWTKCKLTEKERSSPPASVKLSDKQSQSVMHVLTYLLSFFSGGDFLSQPWKMISPPLMFVTVLFPLALPLPSVTSTYRLLKACLFKVLSASGSHWCSLLPPFGNKIGVVLAGDVGRGSCWYRDAEPRLAWRRWRRRRKKKRRNSALGELRTASWRGAAGKNSTDAGWGSITGCLQFVFPTHTTPTEPKEGWAALGWNRMGELRLP